MRGSSDPRRAIKVPAPLHRLRRTSTARRSWRTGCGWILRRGLRRRAAGGWRGPIRRSRCRFRGARICTLIRRRIPRRIRRRHGSRCRYTWPTSGSRDRRGGCRRRTARRSRCRRGLGRAGICLRLGRGFSPLSRCLGRNGGRWPDRICRRRHVWIGRSRVWGRRWRCWHGSSLRAGLHRSCRGCRRRSWRRHWCSSARALCGRPTRITQNSHEQNELFRHRIPSRKRIPEMRIVMPFPLKSQTRRNGALSGESRSA